MTRNSPAPSRYLPFSPYMNELDPQGRPKPSSDPYRFLSSILNDSFRGLPYAYHIIFHPTGIKAPRVRSSHRPLSATADFGSAMQDTWQRVTAFRDRIRALTQSECCIYHEQFVSIVHHCVLVLTLTVTFLFMGVKTAVVVSTLVLMIHAGMLVSETNSFITTRLHKLIFFFSFPPFLHFFDKQRFLVG